MFELFCLKIIVLSFFAVVLALTWLAEHKGLINETEVVQNTQPTGVPPSDEQPKDSTMTQLTNLKNKVMQKNRLTAYGIIVAGSVATYALISCGQSNENPAMVYSAIALVLLVTVVFAVPFSIKGLATYRMGKLET